MVYRRQNWIQQNVPFFLLHAEKIFQIVFPIVNLSRCGLHKSWRHAPLSLCWVSAYMKLKVHEIHLTGNSNHTLPFQNIVLECKLVFTDVADKQNSWIYYTFAVLRAYRNYCRCQGCWSSLTLFFPINTLFFPLSEYIEVKWFPSRQTPL